MKMLSFFRSVPAFLACLLLVTLINTTPLFAQDTEDSRMFLAGFNAFQQKSYPEAITRFEDVLQKHPESPLRDMTLFWLARSYHKAGNRPSAARYMAQFTREYPDNPLRNTVDDDLLALAEQYRKDEGSTPQPAAVKPDATQIAREKAEQERIAQAKAEAERLAKETADQEAAEKARILKAKAEAERIAREKTEAERLAALKAEEERQRVAAEAKRLAAQKAEAERLASLQAEQEKQRAAAETARFAQEQAAKTEAERLAALKAQEERLAQEKATKEAAEKARLLRAKAEEERLAREKTEAERLAREKAQAEQLAAQKAEAERLATLKVEQEKQRAAAEAARIAQEQAARAEADRLARVKAEADRLAALKAEEEKLATQKAQEQRRASEKAAAAAAAQTERELTAARKAEASQAAAETTRQERARLKEKAVAEYKGILERFPGTPAARTAEARLKAMGVAVALPTGGAAQPAAAALDSNGVSQTLSLEVAQYAAFEFELQAPTAPVAVARRASIPFELHNRGNGQDRFYLGSGFPSEFNARFAAAASPEQIINQTPELAPGERFKGMLHLQLPPATIDGFRIAHPIKAASQFMAEASQSRVVSLTAAAPLLRAVIKASKTALLPGEKVEYTVTLLNIGSLTAEEVTLRLNFPAQYQPVAYESAGFRQEMQAALVQDGLTLKSGESRTFTVTYQLKEEALAKEELIVRADLVNNALETKTSFLSNAAVVLPVSELALRMAHEQLTAVPGQTIYLPVRLTNRGNRYEQISLTAHPAAQQKVTIYHDQNRDGLHQPGEPEVAAIGPLGPREEAALLLKISTPHAALDGAVEKLTITATTDPGKQNAVATAEARFTYSRPVLQLAMKGREGRMVPGELLTVDFDILNQGSNLAKQVELEVTWPDQMELVTASQAAGQSQSGSSNWRFNELGAGEKRVVKASFRIKSGTSVGTGVQLKSRLTYQDQAGNRY